MTQRFDEALSLGIVLGLMSKHKAPPESFRAVLSLPEAKEIARQEPERLLGSLCRQYGVSLEEEEEVDEAGKT